MFLSVAKSIFDIDNVGKRWGVRILYLITVVLNAAIHFNPWADTDFTPLQNWVMTVYDMNDYDPERYNALMSNIPLSTGNLIYLFSAVIGVIILLASAYLYAALFVRNFRKEIHSYCGAFAVNYNVFPFPRTDRTSVCIYHSCCVSVR